MQKLSKDKKSKSLEHDNSSIIVKDVTKSSLVEFDNSRDFKQSDFLQFKPIFKSIRHLNTSATENKRKNKLRLKKDSPPSNENSKNEYENCTEKKHFDCKNNQCKQKFVNYDQMLVHINHECPFTKLNCNNCDLFDIARQDFAGHQMTCKLNSINGIHDLSSSNSELTKESKDLCSLDQLNVQTNLRKKLLDMTINQLNILQKRKHKKRKETVVPKKKTKKKIKVSEIKTNSKDSRAEVSTVNRNESNLKDSVVSRVDQVDNSAYKLEPKSAGINKASEVLESNKSISSISEENLNAANENMIKQKTKSKIKSTKSYCSIN